MSMNPVNEIDEQRAMKRIDSAYSRIALMTPMQIKLEESGTGSKRLQMKEVLRDFSLPDKYKSMTIKSIFQNLNGSDEQHNFLSKFKMNEDKAQNRPKLVVCICAYNQDKNMLKQSLTGIYDSLEEFANKAGILTNQIVVVVIFDGIEKICRGSFEEDLVTLFDQVDFYNGFILREGEKSYEHYLREGRPQDIKWDEVSLFSDLQIKGHSQQRFRMRYEQYMRHKRLQKACLNPNRSIDIDKVQEQVRERYIALKEQEIQKKVNHYINTNTEKIQRQELNRKAAARRRYYTDSFESYDNRKLYMDKVYLEILQNCKKYFASRMDTSLLYPMKYLSDKARQEGIDPNQSGLNVILCVKHKNAGKLSSHALFFLGFCQTMKPQLCLLLDVGLKPLDDSIFKMFEYMSHNTQVGGSCGYMGLQMQRNGDQFGNVEMDNLDWFQNMLHNSIFSIQRAQMFEYHFGHLIDKPFEAAFRFIHVLPGAFSCYRWNSLEGNTLNEYLSPVLDANKQKTLEEQNRFLAEDRTLSLILKQKGFGFAYLPKAKAVVDPAKDLVVMMGQRRRWINGSWFAFFHVFEERSRINDCWTQFQFLYYYFIHGLSYISIGIYFTILQLTIWSVIQPFQKTDPMGFSKQTAVALILFLYVFILGSVFFLSLNLKNNDKRFQSTYFLASTLLGIFGLVTMGLLGKNIFEVFTSSTNIWDCNSKQGFQIFEFSVYNSCLPSVIRIMMIATVAIYIIHVIFSFNIRIIWEIIISVPSYLFYAPTYLHILMIYAFCKIDDFTWGTKGLQATSAASNQLLAEQNKRKKYKHAGKYLFWNVIVAIVLSAFLRHSDASTNLTYAKLVVIAVLSGLFFAITAFKFILSMCYLSYVYLCDFSNSFKPQEIKQNLQRCQQTNNVIQRRIEEMREKRNTNVLTRLRENYQHLSGFYRSLR